jgi:hypothetical protein
LVVFHSLSSNSNQLPHCCPVSQLFSPDSVMPVEYPAGGDGHPLSAVGAEDHLSSATGAAEAHRSSAASAAEDLSPPQQVSGPLMSLFYSLYAGSDSLYAGSVLCGYERLCFHLITYLTNICKQA